MAVIHVYTYVGCCLATKTLKTHISKRWWYRGDHELARVDRTATAYVHNVIVVINNSDYTYISIHSGHQEIYNPKLRVRQKKKV